MRRNFGIYGVAGKGPSGEIDSPPNEEIDSPLAIEDIGWDEPPPLPKWLTADDKFTAEYVSPDFFARRRERSRSPLVSNLEKDSPKRRKKNFPFSSVTEASCYALGRRISDVKNKFAMFANVSIKPGLRTYIFNEVAPDYDTEDFFYTGQSFVAFSRNVDDGWNFKLDSTTDRGSIFEVQTKPNWNPNYDSLVTKISPLLSDWRTCETFHRPCGFGFS